jgi:hypothetical protein
VNIVNIGVVGVDEEGCCSSSVLAGGNIGETTLKSASTTGMVANAASISLKKKNPLHAWAAEPFQTLLHSAYIDERWEKASSKMTSDSLTFKTPVTSLSSHQGLSLAALTASYPSALKSHLALAKWMDADTYQFHTA